MSANGTLKYGLRKTPVLSQNLTSYNGLFTLKQDDPDGHANALAEILCSEELAETFHQLAMIHIISFLRIGRDKILVQSNFDGGDIVSYWEIIIKSASDVVMETVSHFEGAPGPNADVTAIGEFLASAQTDLNVLSYYCAYPSLTVNQIYRDADWRTKVMDLQKSLARPAEKVVAGEVASSI